MMHDCVLLSLLSPALPDEPPLLLEPVFPDDEPELDPDDELPDPDDDEPLELESDPELPEDELELPLLGVWPAARADEMDDAAVTGQMVVVSTITSVVIAVTPALVTPAASVAGQFVIVAAQLITVDVDV